MSRSRTFVVSSVLLMRLPLPYIRPPVHRPELSLATGLSSSDGHTEFCLRDAFQVKAR